MYKTLQQAAVQESAFKAVIEELTRSLTDAKTQTDNSADTRASPSPSTSLSDAHAALDTLISGDWGRALQLPSISESDTVGDESDNIATMIQTGTTISSLSKPRLGVPSAGGHPARVLELQRQVEDSMTDTHKFVRVHVYTADVRFKCMTLYNSSF